MTAAACSLLNDLEVLEGADVPRLPRQIPRKPRLRRHDACGAVSAIRRDPENDIGIYCCRNLER